MADHRLSIFFSYRRVEVDTAFVNRLEADLRAREYKTWVDRFRLEGGEDWRKKIDEAIAACNLFLMVLSPDAFKSDWVTYEFDESQRLGKRLMPVVCRRFSTPAYFSAIDGAQQVEFADNTDNPLNSQYARNLKRLLDAIETIEDPSLDLSAGDDVLYLRAHDLERKNDLERAARILQHLVDRNAGSVNGNASRELEQLNQRLYALRAQRLKTTAIDAREAGQYGAEVGALQALIALGDQDSELVRWAHEYLDVAIENSRFVGQYGIVQTLMEPGPRQDLAKAIKLLQDLYDKASFYRDPAGLAPELGVVVPKSYEEARDLQRADEARAKRVAAAMASRDSALAVERARADAATERQMELWESARNFALQQSDRLSTSEPDIAFRSWEADSSQLVAALTRVSSAEEALSSVDKVKFEEVVASGCVLSVLLYVGVITLIVVGTLLNFFLTPVSTFFNVPSNNQLLSVSLVLAIPGIVVVLPWLTVVYTGVLNPMRLRHRVHTANQRAADLGRQWLSKAEQEHERRLSAISSESQSLTEASTAHFQAELSAAASEYSRAIADIAERYAKAEQR